MMDNWCAPQWTDFTRSPQLTSDSYFDVDHKELEPASLLNSLKYEMQEPKKAEVSTDSLEEDAKSADDSCEVTPAAPKIAFFVTLDEEPEKISGLEQLPEAMKNLQICAKTRKPLLSSKRRSKTMTRRSINNTISGDCPSKYLEGKCETAKRMSLGMKHSPKEIQSQGNNKRLSYKIIRRRESTLFRSNRYSLGKNGPRVLTSQYNRRSVIKGRRRSNQFVSLAEAVSKFHSGTPDRFRTCAKDLKPAALMRLKKAPLKLTYPISPALRCNQRCKQRARMNKVLTKEQREEQELEEMKKHQIKANPVPANILKAPVPLKKVEKKPNTVTEEFKLTQPKSFRKTIMPLLSCKQEKKEDTKSTSSTSLHTLASQKKDADAGEKPDKMAPAQRKYLRQTAGPILSPSKCLTKKEEHKSSSSVATTGSNTQPKVTRTVPFAFEARTKELLEKKEQKLKTLQSQGLSKMKVEFHARPAPNFSKPTVAAPKDQPKKMITCPFSFAERDKSLAKKKEQQVKQILDEREKPRHFHANPVPTFKPVAVHGLAKDARIRDKSVDRTKRLNRTKDDQENKQPNIISTSLGEALKKEDAHDGACNKSIGKKAEGVPKPKTAVELNTDKRAKERQDFDEKLRKKEQENEVKRLEEERQRMEREKRERAELRKRTEVKARPMPLYKPLQIIKSTKPPTSPRSPAWAGKLKAKNIP